MTQKKLQLFILGTKAELDARNVSFISLSFKMSVSGFDYIETLGPHLRSVAFIRAQVLDLKYDAPREENQV